jgi:GTP cyclohydrolase I
MVEINHSQIEEAIRMILEAGGENPDREGLLDTPKRVAKMYEEIFEGINLDPKESFDLVFSEEHEELVLVKDISFISMCEHHLLPFYGKAHIAYLPRNGKVTGLSKLARAIEIVAKRPQIQERMTSTVADSIYEILDPHGVMVVIEAEHMCMTMRGVKKPGAKAITTAVRGSLVNDSYARSEILNLIHN